MYENRPRDVEFIEEGHLYLKGGVLIPSVSQILDFIFPNKYAGIPSHVLSNKANFGTEVHQAIQDYEEKGETPSSSNIDVRLAFEQYLRIKDSEVLTPLNHEELIVYEDKYAGRLDMIADVKLYRCLVDVKTTQKLDQESLAWQLGMYKLAWEHLNPKQPIEHCYCLWLPKKDLGQLVKVLPKTKQQIEKVLIEYGKARENQ